MLNNAEPYRRALCSCCVRRTMKDSPSDSWLHLAGSITLSLSLSLSLFLLLPPLLCCPEWQGDSRLGISQSLPSSSVPSACQPASQPGSRFQKEMGHYWGKGGRETTEQTKAWLSGGKRGELGQGKFTKHEPRVGVGQRGRMGGCRKHAGEDRTAELEWDRQRRTTVQFGE